MTTAPGTFASGEIGAQAAERVIRTILNGTQDREPLYDALQAVLVTGEEERLRMFCRLIQRRLKLGSR